jgi:hypothetical protein
MKIILTTGWSFMRVFRIVTGVAALTYAIVKHDPLAGIAGSFLLFTGVFNVTVCGAGGCALPKQNNQK